MGRLGYGNTSSRFFPVPVRCSTTITVRNTSIKSPRSNMTHRGSATQVMLSMPFRDMVGQNPIDTTEVNRTHGHPRVMSSVRINSVQEKWPYPPWQTESSVQKLRAPV